MIRSKKLLRAIIKSNLDCNCISKQKQSLEVFCKKGALRNFAKFTGKHLCEISENTLLQNTSERLLLSRFQ